MSDEPLLSQSVAALTQYFVGDTTMGETLTRVSQLTMVAVPHAAMVGITMMVDGEAGTFVFTHPQMPEIDRAQYGTGRGPCVEAFRTGKVFVIDSTTSDRVGRSSVKSHGLMPCSAPCRCRWSARRARSAQ